MEDPIHTKVCKGPLCKGPEGHGTRKPLDEFNKSTQSKDGKQRYCKECNAYRSQIQRTNPKAVEKANKLSTLLAELPNNDNNIVTTYMAVTGVKDRNNANKAVKRLFEGIDGDCTELMRVKLKGNDMMNRFMDYLDRAHNEGNLTEQRDAWTLMFKFMGEWKDKSEVEFKGTTKENRDDKYAQVLKLVDKKKQEE